MKHFMRMALMAGVAVGAWAVSSDRGYSQAADPNAAPNPYKMQDSWLQLPAGRQLGGAIKVQVDHSDGKSIWVFDRCAANGCNPIQKFDANGKFVRGFGANMFVQPHGFYVDKDGNVWAADNGIRNGKGAVVVKFSPEGKVLMTLGHQGMPGNAEGYFNGASSVVVAPNGDIFVGDGHGGNTNDRVVKFDKTGKQITTWGKHGKGQGEFDQLHGIAMDSQGRIFVADRRTISRTRPPILASRMVSASAAPRTARSRPSFRQPMPRLRRPKESASTMPAMSMAAGPARWRCGAGPRAELFRQPGLAITLPVRGG